jgi:hypothetical protein
MSASAVSFPFPSADRPSVDHPSAPASSEPLIVDCDGCTARPAACGDCVVTVLLGPPPQDWDDEERRALAVLAGSGLVPDLRFEATAPPDEPSLG